MNVIAIYSLHKHSTNHNCQQLYKAEKKMCFLKRNCPDPPRMTTTCLSLVAKYDTDDHLPYPLQISIERDKQIKYTSLS